MVTEHTNKLAADEDQKDVGVARNRKVRYADLFIRLIAILLSLTSAIIVGLDKQTKTIPFTLVPSLPPINIPVTAKYHDLSAFTYFVVANAIACSYGALSLILTLANRGGKKGFLTNFIITFDLIMVGILASAVGAAGAIGLIGREGNKHVQWKKVCNVFGRFCDLAMVSVGISLLGSLLFMFLVLLAALNVPKKH